jgi:hypothetical protein
VISLSENEYQQWSNKRADLIKKADQSHFSNDISIDSKEQKA